MHEAVTRKLSIQASGRNTSFYTPTTSIMDHYSHAFSVTSRSSVITRPSVLKRDSIRPNSIKLGLSQVPENVVPIQKFQIFETNTTSDSDSPKRNGVFRPIGAIGSLLSRFSTVTHTDENKKFKFDQLKCNDFKRNKKNSYSPEP